MSADSRRPGFSIQTKLLVMLLGVSIGSSVVVGLVGYISGSDSLRQAAYAQLTETRESRAREITNFFTTTENSLVVYTRGTTAINAVTDFTAGYKALEGSQLSAAQSSGLDELYTSTFAPALAKRTGSETSAAAFIPTDPAERYLQATYTDPGLDTTKSITVANAGDGSAWSAANDRYHDYFHEIINRFGYEDALLMDTEGHVVYSADKNVDLGTNLLTGPYKGTSLASGYKETLNSNVVDFVKLTDFERYQPALGSPVAWIMSPVGENGVTSGVMALQVPISQINTIMTADNGWAEDGLGATGETYLAGPDMLMRSVSRELIENPEQYQKDAISAGTAPEDAARAVAVKGTILIQPVRTAPVKDALAGQTGLVQGTSYLGTETLSAYAPLDINGLQWVIVAKINTSEAFSAVSDFTRNLILAIVALIIVVSLLSLVLAQVFARPVRRLVGAVRQVSAGDLAVEVPQGGRDEFGDLGTAFNEMARSLRIKQSLIDEQSAENEKLLSTLMPADVARRYKEGQETIADVHQDVSVLFADLIGYNDFSASFPAEKELSLLNGIVASFDEAATRMGVETVRTLREGYLASCGLVVPRIDNVRRMVDFALELRKIIERFNGQHSTSLSIRIGIDAGTVSSGLVGRSSLAYDMWGDAVNLANRVQSVSGSAGIFVSQSVRDRMRDAAVFVEAGTLDTADGEQTVWKIQ
ncbi:HAMP domain-containing protein [Subtercola sp. PAMC28395]|uniref:adenylate/guanylate cyclase domain-containing protein n=1 Tax=Subtercola sp. PAMC28395 TaxID=2846775 RepID=UPI001C0BC0D6|nr:adenylate/guanylate cyclase domain-containing protein [Subtercola sp. PAMC28395]QWT23876.1 HAMP domain-containing protein [Subtercola sp. PAMC28395]